MYSFLFCSDVDGTLISRDGSFYSGARELCASLKQYSWNIALCSARPIESLAMVARELKYVDYLSALGGAVIAKSGINKEGFLTFRIINCTNPFEKSIVETLLQWTFKNGILDFWAYDDTKWYCMRTNLMTLHEEKIIKVTPCLCSASELSEKSIIKVVIPKCPIELRTELCSIADNLGLKISLSTGSQIEINRKSSADKGIEIIKSDLENNNHCLVSALGDGQNDFEMLNRANISFTFSDAHYMLTNSAKYLLDSNREYAYRQILNLLSDPLRLT